MKPSDIYSMVSGKSREECQKILDKNKELNDKIQDLVIVIDKRTDNVEDLIGTIASVITSLIIYFPNDLRMAILAQVISFIESGEADEMVERVEKFRND